MLHEEGLSWLATEIIEAIERGPVSDEDLDWHVDEDRRSISEKPDREQFKAVWDAGERDIGGHRIDQPILPDDQVHLAVDLMVGRLKSTVHFLDSADAELAKLVGERIEIQFTFDDSQVSTLDIERAKQAISRLVSMREALLQELLSSS